MENHIEELIKKAANAQNADAAMKFSQAAQNAANAMHTLRYTLELLKHESKNS